MMFKAESVSNKQQVTQAHSPFVSSRTTVCSHITEARQITLNIQAELLNFSHRKSPFKPFLSHCAFKLFHTWRHTFCHPVTEFFE